MPLVRKNRSVPNPQERSSKKTSKSILVVISVVGALVILAAGFLAYPFVKNLLFPPPPVIVVEEKPEIIPVEEPQEAIQEPVSSIPKGYYVIIGSFRDRKSADLWVNNMKDQNLTLEVLHFEEIGAYRVSAGSYDNIHTAYNETINVMDILRTLNVWVLENI